MNPHLKSIAAWCGHLLLAVIVTACATYPKSSREDQWSYFEEWDSNRDVNITPTEFVDGYVRDEFFKTWAGKKRELERDQLTSKLNNSNGDLKASLAAAGNWDTVASARAGSGSTATDPQGSSLDQFVSLADANSNRRVTREEWAQAMFKVADENRDGNLTPIEFYLWQLLRG